jgi:large subunit ribosomal protein L4
MKTDVYNLNNEIVGTMELPASVFGVKWRESLVKQVLDAQSANKRIPWAHVRDRSEVRGGGRKPWRQKGTGRARHGSNRSPIWVGGGKSHGPRNDRDYSEKVNKKMKHAALFSVLSRKMKDGELKVLDSFVLTAPKTKVLASSLFPMLGMKKGAKRFNVIMVPAHEDKMLARAASNLTKAMTLEAASLNIHDILNHQNLFIEKEAVGVIEKHYKI